MSTVSLDSLSAQQLTTVKKQLDEEVEHLTTSFAQLQAAQIKFRDCLRCVKAQGSTPGKSTHHYFMGQETSRIHVQRMIMVCCACARRAPEGIGLAEGCVYSHADSAHTRTDKKEILVPLTNSLYVKGNISQPDRVLVDIGTGFYVEKVSLSPILLS